MKNPNASRFVKQITSLLFGLFLVQFILGAFIIYQVATKEITDQLQTIAQRVKEDITLQNGKWDTHRYNADPDLPGTYPLYIFASDGFVIDRWKPVHGFLDTSDAKKLLSYQSPTTVQTDINQDWRVVSKPIISQGQQIGVITVGYFQPSSEQLTNIDAELKDNANLISSKVTTKNNTINTDQLDVRDLGYNVVFQIVDSYNRIITKTDNNNSIDRLPNFIDTSYIGTIINSPRMQTVTDDVTGEKFLVITKPLVNNQNYVTGVIVVGKSIAFISNVLRDYIIVESIFGLLLTTLTTYILFVLSKRFAKTYHPIEATKPEITHIAFDKKSGILRLNKQEIEFPFATNQYYLLEALFSLPKKRWEIDELLERFGEVDFGNSRKVYDAMLIVNKKLAEYLDEKLIIVKDKTYQVNPQLLSKIG